MSQHKKTSHAFDKEGDFLFPAFPARPGPTVPAHLIELTLGANSGKKSNLDLESNHLTGKSSGKSKSVGLSSARLDHSKRSTNLLAGTGAGPFGRSSLSRTIGRLPAEDDYIKNLQQQVYLLELETKYLRGKRADGDFDDGLTEKIEHTSLPLKDTFRSLKLKYVEVQDKFKKEMSQIEEQLDTVKHDNHSKDLTIESLQQEKQNLQEEIQRLRDLRVQQTDIVHQEFLSLRQQHQLIIAERNQLQASFRRVRADHESLEEKLVHAQEENATLKEKLAAQEASNQTLQTSLETAIRAQHAMETQFELHSIDKTKEILQSLTVNHEKLKEDCAQLHTKIAQLEKRLHHAQEENQALQNENDVLHHQKASWKVELQEKQREVDRATEVATMFREKEEHRIRSKIEARERAKKEGSSEELAERDAEHLETLTELDMLRVSESRLKDEIRHLQSRIQVLTSDLEVKSAEASKLREDLSENEERQSALTAQIQKVEEQCLIIHEDKSATSASLESLQTVHTQVQQKLSDLTRELNDTQCALDVAQEEVSRLKHVERIAQQMTEWKSQMEENARLANEMQNLVKSFATQSDPTSKSNPSLAMNKRKSRPSTSLSNPMQEQTREDSSLQQALSSVLDQ